MTTEEHLTAVLVLIGCILFLAVADAVGIVIADGLAEVTGGGMQQDRADSAWVQVTELKAGPLCNLPMRTDGLELRNART